MTAIGNIFSNSCHHVRGVFRDWIKGSCGPTGRKLDFGTGIILGTMSSRRPVFQVIVPWRSRRGSVDFLYVRVQERFIYFRQRTQKPRLCSTECLGQLVNDPAFNFLINLHDVILSSSRNGRVLWLAVPSDFLCSPWNSCYFLLFLSPAIRSKRPAQQWWRLNFSFYFRMNFPVQQNVNSTLMKK